MSVPWSALVSVLGGLPVQLAQALRKDPEVQLAQAEAMRERRERRQADRLNAAETRRVMKLALRWARATQRGAHNRAAAHLLALARTGVTAVELEAAIRVQDRIADRSRAVTEHDLVVVETPYRATSGASRSQLDAYLVRVMRRMFEEGAAPFASHRLYPGVLDDNNPVERRQGIQAGLAWAEHATRTVVGVDLGVSEGMLEGIDDALDDGRPYELLSLDQDLEALEAAARIIARHQATT